VGHEPSITLSPCTCVFDESDSYLSFFIIYLLLLRFLKNTLLMYLQRYQFMIILFIVKRKQHCMKLRVLFISWFSPTPRQRYTGSTLLGCGFSPGLINKLYLYINKSKKKKVLVGILKHLSEKFSDNLFLNKFYNYKLIIMK